MEVSLALAFAAGLLSFVSPCVLALLPVYLAFLGDAAVPATDVAVPPGARPCCALPSCSSSASASMFIVLGISLGLVGSPLFGAPVRQIDRRPASSSSGWG